MKLAEDADASGTEQEEKPDKTFGEGKGDVPSEPEKPKEEEKPKEPAFDAKAEIEKLRAQNEELQNVTKGALKRATEAESFVSNLTGRLERVAERHTAGPTADEGDVREKLRERIAEDPMSVLDEHYRSRTQPLVQRFLEQQGRTNRELFITKMSNSDDGREVLKDYLEEVDDFLKDFDPEHRAAPDAYDAALRWVLAKPQNFQKEVKRQLNKEREKEKLHFVEPGAAGERAPKETKRSLSAIEKEVAVGLGLTEEEYLKYKEA